jgi:hypothetical protein
VTTAVAASLKCPECEFVAVTTGGLSHHRSKRHGVLSAHAADVARRRAGIPKGKTDVIAEKEAVAKPASNGHVKDPLLYAIAVGRVQELCRNLAEEHDVPAREFTSRFARLLYDQTVR